MPAPWSTASLISSPSPAEAAWPAVLTECGAKGIPFAIIHTAGFSEIGEDGLEAEVVRIAREGNIRFIGPNCMGFFSPEIGFNTVVTHVPISRQPGRTAFIGQSGWVTKNLLLMGDNRGLRFKHVVNIGNQSDLSLEDFLEYSTDNTGTDVIGFYIEGVKRGRDFLRLAKQASRKKPVIVWKGGHTGAGAVAAASHTASLAVSSAVFTAGLRQSGVITAWGLEQMMGLMMGFLSPVLPAGPRVGVLTQAGGGGVALADWAENSGLTMPVLPDKTQQKLKEKLLPHVPLVANMKNPVDMVWGPLENENEITGACARLILAHVDSLVIITYRQITNQFATNIAALRDDVGKPVIVVPAHPTTQPQAAVLAQHNVPYFDFPERALEVLAAMVAYSRFRQTRV